MKLDPKAQLLIETYELSSYQLDEAAAKDGKVVLSGIFARADVPTKNKRVYGRKDYLENVQRMLPLMKRKAVYGELDHPADGKTKLQRASHYLTNLEVLEDGTVMGTMELLPDKPGTPAAQLHSIVQSGGAIGVSSRGFGLTETDKNGNTMIKEGTFRLDSFDAVADPAVEVAYPSVHYEDVCENGVDMTAPTVADLRTAYPTLIEEIEASALGTNGKQLEEAAAVISELTERVKGSETAEDVKRKLASQVAEAIERKRTEIADSVRAELLADPKTAAARGVLGGIISLVRPFTGDNDPVFGELADLKVRYADLASKLDEAIEYVRETTLAICLERSLSGNPSADAIRRVIGPVGVFKSREDLEARLAVLKEELKRPEPIRVESAEVDALRSELESMAKNLATAESRAAMVTGLQAQGETLRAQIKSLEEENQELEEAAERFEFERDVEMRIAHRPDREKIREGLLECESLEEVANVLTRLDRRETRGVSPRGRVMEQIRNRLGARGRELLDDDASLDRNADVDGSRDGTGPAPRSASQPVSPVLESELASIGLSVNDVVETNGRN
jgi:hypothetical protein